MTEMILYVYVLSSISKSLYKNGENGEFKSSDLCTCHQVCFNSKPTLSRRKCSVIFIVCITYNFIELLLTYADAFSSDMVCVSILKENRKL